MIYATEQQVVVTAVLIVFCTLVALFIGIWYGHSRGLEQAAEEQRWEREQAKARRTRPVYRQPPEIAHDWFDRDETARALADWETVLEPTAVLTPVSGQAIDTGEIRAITDRVDEWMATWIGDGHALRDS